MTTMAETPTCVTAGVDTHRDVHVAAALDERGAQLGVRPFATDPAGHHGCWHGLSVSGKWTGSGSKGPEPMGRGWPASCTAGATWWWKSVVPTARSGAAMASPTRSMPSLPLEPPRRERPQSSPRPGPGMSRRSGPCGWSVGPRSKTARRRSTRLRALVVTGPDDLRQAFRGVTIHKLVAGAVRLRPADPATADGATRFALRELARRVQHLDAEIDRTRRPSCDPSSPSPPPPWSPATASALKRPPPFSSPPATTPVASATKRLSLTSAEALRSMLRPA